MTQAGVEVSKAFRRAGTELGEPYNLRRSFCSDMFEMGIDPALYEHCTDHSTQVSMKHYQILHNDRLQRGLDTIKMFEDTTEEPEESPKDRGEKKPEEPENQTPEAA